MKSLWFKFLCVVFGHRWEVIVRSDNEDGDVLYRRGPPKGCFSVCVICRKAHDDLARRGLSTHGQY